MKKLTSTFTKTFGTLLLLMAVVSSCKKNKTEDPAPSTTSSMTGTIDGKAINIAESGLATTFYYTPGDNVSSLMTTATLDASGGAMNFFIPDISAGSAAISPKLGTSSNPGNPNLKINASGTTTVQIYVSYTVGGNTYYAISGTVTISYDDTQITVKWDISFKDATGRVFTSSGNFTIYFYKTVTKAKTEVKDPTPVSATPTIDNIAPTAGAAGDEISIAGTNFSTTTTENVVNFNGVAAAVRTATATKLTVVAPTGTTGAVTVKVKNSAVTTGPVFTYVLPPTLTGMTPSSGKAGDVLTLAGTNFSTTLSDNAVTINGTAATVTAATATQLTVTVPQGVSTGIVAVTVRGKLAASGSFNPTFTVIVPPTITLVAPLQGVAGTVVTITGTNFSTVPTDNVVKFNGTVATVTAATATSLTVSVPTGATTGAVTVTTKGTDATAGVSVNTTFNITTTSNFGTPGQAYGLTAVYFQPSYKAVDNDGNLWVVDSNGQINKESYLGGDQLKTLSTTAFPFATLTSYLCNGIARDANGNIHAYIYGSSLTGNPSFVVSISTAGVVTKDFDTQFYEKGSTGFAITADGIVLMISTRSGSSDVWRLKTDGTFDTYLKGGTGTDNTLGAANAYGIQADGLSLYVLSYLTGSPNTGAVIARFDATKTRTVIATLPDGGYVDGALTASKFSNPSCFAVNGSIIYIGDGQRIRKLDTRANTVSTFAGSGVTGTTYSGDALAVTLNAVGAILVDPNHSVLYNFGQFTHELTRIAY